MTAEIIPVFQDISPTPTGSPKVNAWHAAETVDGVSDEAVGGMLAQGWAVIATHYSYDFDQESFTSEIIGRSYTMYRRTMNNDAIVHDLLNSFTHGYNEGREANQKRYEDVIRLWTEMLDKSQGHLTDAKTGLKQKLDAHMITLDALENDYSTFFTGVQTELDDLEVTLNADRTRVNDQFDGQLAGSDQNLVNRGFYSSAMISNIDAGIEERRALALTEITEREQRLKADIILRKNEIYLNVLRMRASLIDAQMGLTNREQEFLAYQLDTRNNLLVGLFRFVEAREDSYPGLGSTAQVAASLGQPGNPGFRQ
jgi:hypothetical protein